ncbi:hypothetical protein KMT30_50000, partial [Streptomyces sp. IBSBF 2953]|nr:hypothetical protein [Streptomyces hayashii]
MKRTRITQNLNTTDLIAIVAAGVRPGDGVEGGHDDVARLRHRNVGVGGHGVSITNFVSFLPYRTKRREARN